MDVAEITDAAVLEHLLSLPSEYNDDAEYHRLITDAMRLLESRWREPGTVRVGAGLYMFCTRQNAWNMSLISAFEASPLGQQAMWFSVRLSNCVYVYAVTDDSQEKLWRWRNDIERRVRYAMDDALQLVGKPSEAVR